MREIKRSHFVLFDEIAPANEIIPGTRFGVGGKSSGLFSDGA
jgi:hypothetical protein